MPAPLSIFLALLAAACLVLGSLVPTWARSKLVSDRLSQLIGFSAGLMLATALHELIPEAVEMNHDRAMWGTGAGFLLLYSVERLTHFHACRHRDCDLGEPEILGPEMRGLELPVIDAAFAVTADDCGHSHHHHPHAGAHGHAGHTHAHSPVTATGHADITALAGMSVHNFADGLTTAAAFAVSPTVGLVAIFAIVLHQLAAGASLGAIMLRVGRAPRRVLVSTVLSASFIVWGALFYNFVGFREEAARGIILGIAGGSFLYVAACDLLPEAHDGDESWRIMATTLLGYACALAATVLFGDHAH
jgi:zinc and cadmium transporter